MVTRSSPPQPAAQVAVSYRRRATTKGNDKMCIQCKSNAMQEAVKRRDEYKDYLEALPGDVYNANIENFQATLDELDKEIDRLIDEENAAHPVVVAYQLEKAMDDEYPLTFSGGEVDEARPYKMNTASAEDDLPF